MKEQLVSALLTVITLPLLAVDVLRAPTAPLALTPAPNVPMVNKVLTENSSLIVLILPLVLIAPPVSSPCQAIKTALAALRAPTAVRNHPLAPTVRPVGRVLMARLPLPVSPRLLLASSASVVPTARLVMPTALNAMRVTTVDLVLPLASTAMLVPKVKTT
jgi:hypothetical protein